MYPDLVLGWGKYHVGATESKCSSFAMSTAQNSSGNENVSIALLDGHLGWTWVVVGPTFPASLIPHVDRLHALRMRHDERGSNAIEWMAYGLRWSPSIRVTSSDRTYAHVRSV